MVNSRLILNSCKDVYSLPPISRNLIFSSIGLLTIIISVGFALLGAWPVLPFAGLECLGLYFAWRWLRLHEYDYENISIDNHCIKIEIKDGIVEETKTFNLDWIQVILESRRPGCRMRLILRCYGEDLEIGKLLRDNVKKDLATKIRRMAV